MRTKSSCIYLCDHACNLSGSREYLHCAFNEREVVRDAIQHDSHCGHRPIFLKDISCEMPRTILNNTFIVPTILPEEKQYVKSNTMGILKGGHITHVSLVFDTMH